MDFTKGNADRLISALDVDPFRIGKLEVAACPVAILAGSILAGSILAGTHRFITSLDSCPKGGWESRSAPTVGNWNGVGPFLPSTALSASGSRGLPYRDSQPRNALRGSPEKKVDYNKCIISLKLSDA